MPASKAPADLRNMAARCRRLVSAINDPPAENALLSLASDYEGKAEELERERSEQAPAPPY